MSTIEIEDDGWFEGISEEYELDTKKDEIITMKENEIDYLDPHDIRNHSENILTDIKDTPADTVKKRRNRKKTQFSFTVPYDNIISNLKSLTDINRDSLLIDSDVDSPVTLLEALNEEDSSQSISNDMKNDDEEWVRDDSTTNDDLDEEENTEDDDEYKTSQHFLTTDEEMVKNNINDEDKTDVIS